MRELNKRTALPLKATRAVVREARKVRQLERGDAVEPAIAAPGRPYAAHAFPPMPPCPRGRSWLQAPSRRPARDSVVTTSGVSAALGQIGQVSIGIHSRLSGEQRLQSHRRLGLLVLEVQRAMPTDRLRSG